MSTNSPVPLHGVIVEEDIHLTLIDLCQACRTKEVSIMEWVREGVLEPSGSTPADWRFSGRSLRRARQALRLSHDLEVNVAGVALALDLMDEIAALRARLRRASPG
jgi:chaperone modulatory protein CbpM